jgi:hypothetical protein
MSKKVSLGTKWAFQEIEDPSGKLPPLYGIDADGTSYRIMPSRNVPGEWNLDVHKKLSGWEDAVSGKTFKTPEAAAKALVKMHAETQSKASVKNIQTQLRSARPGFYEERSMGNMRAILERAAGEAIEETVGANVVTRMAEAMLGAPKLAVLFTRVFDDESQEGMFAGMIQGPLEALIAKALDAAGATVSGGVLAKSNREMRGAARGDLSAE